MVGFAGSVHTAVNFSTNLGATKSAINGFVSNGGTALNDGIIRGAQLTVAEKRTNAPRNRTALVIFTDGKENRSSSTALDAVNAIRRSTTCDDINGCFLIFVGGGGGSTQLRTLALQAGRTFRSTTDFAELKRLFLNVVNDPNVCN